MKDWENFISIYGNVEGARAAFEKACETTLRACNPGKEVRQIEVGQGDGGVDIAISDPGQLSIDVFQCKFFLPKLGDSQKSQVRNSFNRAIKNDKYHMTSWTLCIPLVLTLDEDSWWKKWAFSMIEEHNLPANFIRLINGNELAERMQQTGVYNMIFKKEVELELKELHRLVKEDRFTEEQYRDRSITILEALYVGINSAGLEQNRAVNTNVVMVQFYRDVEIDYISMREQVETLRTKNVACSDISYSIVDDANYLLLKDNLNKNLDLLKNNHHYSSELLYSLIDTSYIIQNTEKGLLQGIKEIVNNTLCARNGMDYFYQNSIYWFAKTMRLKLVGSMHYYQLKTGYSSPVAKDYSWFNGHVREKADFEKFYQEENPRLYRATLKNDVYDHVDFLAAQPGFFKPLAEKDFYKYGLPVLMHRFVVENRKKLFHGLDELDIHDEED